MEGPVHAKDAAVYVCSEASVFFLLDDGEQVFVTRASLLTFVCSIEFIRYVLLGEYLMLYHPKINGYPCL